MPESIPPFETASETLPSCPSDLTREILEAGDLAALQPYLTRGLDRREFQNFLSGAARRGNQPMLEAVLAAGPPKSVVDRAVYPASTSGHVNLFPLLAAAGADFQGKADRPVITQAAMKGQVEAVRVLIEDYGCDPNTLVTAPGHWEVDYPEGLADGHGPLVHAARTGNREMVEMLLAHGAERSQKTTQGRSVADMAEAFGHSEIAALLRA